MVAFETFDCCLTDQCGIGDNIGLSESPAVEELHP
jgi:hypothetical protein